MHKDCSSLETELGVKRQQVTELEDEMKGLSLISRLRYPLPMAV